MNTILQNLKYRKGGFVVLGDAEFGPIPVTSAEEAEAACCNGAAYFASGAFAEPTRRREHLVDVALLSFDADGKDWLAHLYDVSPDDAEEILHGMDDEELGSLLDDHAEVVECALADAGLTTPHYEIRTGYGSHVHYRVAGDIDAVRIATRGVIRAVNNGFEILDPQASDVGTRYFRLPGGLNLKNPDRPRPVALVAERPDLPPVVAEEVLERLRHRQREVGRATHEAPGPRPLPPCLADSDHLADAWNAGSRHAAALAVAAVLRKAGREEEVAVAYVRALAEGAGDEEVADRLAAVRTTFERPVSGIAACTAMRDLGLCEEPTGCGVLDDGAPEVLPEAEHVTLRRFRIASDGVYEHRTNREGESWWEKIGLSPVFPTEDLEDEDGDHFWRLWTPAGEVVVPRGDIFDARRLRGLNDRLLLGPHAAELTRFFAEVAALNEVPAGRAFTTAGWHGDQLLCRADQFAVDDDLVRRLVARGTFEGWLAAVRKVTHQPGPLLSVCAALASPLLEMLGAEGSILHFRHDSSRGKTTSACLAASVFGVPRPHAPWWATPVGLERMAGFHRHLPLVLDDLRGDMPPRLVSELVYKLANGRGKVRGRKIGGLQRQHSWRLAVVSTGEGSLGEQTPDSGTRARVLDVQVEHYDDAAATDGLLEALEEHHGTAGQELVPQLADRLDDIRAAADEFRSRFQGHPVAMRSLRHLGVLFGVGTVLQDLAPLGDPELLDDVAGQLLEDHEEDGTYLERALQVVANHVQRRWTSFGPGAGVYLGRIVGPNVEILATELDDLLSRKGFSPRRVRKEAEEAKVLQRGSRGTRRTKNRRVGGRVMRHVVLRLPDVATFVRSQRTLAARRVDEDSALGRLLAR